MMMLGSNVKMAMSSLRTSKWRSFLTMLGIIIGVSSVVITVSLGEGLKQQVSGQINQFGNNMVSVRSGKIITKDDKGKISSINLLAAFASSTLTQEDVVAITKVPTVSTAVPMSYITNTASGPTGELNNVFVLGAGAGAPQVLNQDIIYGAFYTSDEDSRDYAVIGRNIAANLFGELNPVGKSVTVLGHQFVVHGVFDTFESGTLTTAGTDLNSAIFIPFGAGESLTANKAQIQQILVKGKKDANTETMVNDVQQALLANHKGLQDFTILRQEELLSITNSVLNVITGFISGIAAISLIVGGIGIMNIMLVNVSERTREVGIRKAIGATNRQILSQFLIEGIVLTLTGGILGILLSLLVNVSLRIATDFKPVITWPVILVATGVSVAVGIIFCITPALKASRKDPIDALRNE